MPTRSSDTLVIGAGPIGLAAAARLADGGHRVTVLEARASAGGGAGEVEFAPGFRGPALAHLTPGLDRRLVRALRLDRIGWHPPLPTLALSRDAAPLRIDGLAGPAQGLSPDETARWDAFRARLSAFATALAPFREAIPPRLARGGGDLWRMARIGMGLRRLGRAELRELMRMILLNVADAVEDDLTDPRLMGALAFDATLGSRLGPRSPNTLILLLDRIAQGGRALAPVGGMGALATALAQAATQRGVTIRTNAPVRRILTDGERVTGVELASGETLAAGTILSTLHPGHTLRRLVGPRVLDAGLYARAGQIRSRGAAAHLLLAMDGAPALGPDLSARMVIAPSVDAVEGAFNPVKYGEVPDRPVMEVTIPTARDPSLAPPGGHVLSAIVPFAPHDPPDRPAARAAMLAACLRLLEDHAPGIGAQVRHARLAMPWDIAETLGNPGGCWHHAELAVESMLFLRPLPELARYATPVAGLWLGGAGSHPGGGITGTAGWNAAGALLVGGPT